MGCKLQLKPLGDDVEKVQTTYIIPDGHDKNHGNGEGLVQLSEAANLLKAVTVTERLGHGTAQLGSESGAARGDAVPLRSRDLNLLAVLDKELGELVLLELGNDTTMSHVTSQHCTVALGWSTRDSRELLAGVDRHALAVEIGVAQAVRVVVAAVGVAIAREAVVRVCAAAARRLADVVLVVLARVRREGKSMGVGFPGKAM